MKIEKPGSLRGARELFAYIRKNFRSVPEFAEANGLNRVKVADAIRGKLQRIDVDFAFSIQDATGGVIKAEWWVAARKSTRKAA